ncbi:hypothetical protein ACHAW6_001089 [Cyclotella cf. meneghiniana]
MDQSKRTNWPIMHHSHRSQSPCNLPLSRAARQLFRREASSILLHYFGNTWKHERSGSHRIADDSMDTSMDNISADKLRRKRQKLSHFRVDDGLSDDEWLSLLGFSIDYSQINNVAASQTSCPLHPKYDLFLPNDRNSFILTRRYLTALSTKRFGGLSLPFSGRGARAALTYYEQNAKEPHFDFPTKSTDGRYANNVYIFQCGHCEKTFLSTYYLDRHMEKHHPNLLSDVGSTNATQRPMSICPADICDHLGGVTACAESLRQISPYYGPGTMLGHEYLVPHSDSLFTTSFYNLLYYWHGGKDLDKNTVQKEHSQDDAKRQPPKEGDVSQVAEEMRRRSLQRTNVHIHELRASHVDEFYEQQHYVKDETTQDGLIHKTITKSCSDAEMQRLFDKCQDLIVNCFGNEFDHHNDRSTSIGHETTLAKDLITQICEPLHCDRLLHRMAGHTQLHFVHFNEDWHEHHTFKLGLYGWLVVLVVFVFYGCVFIFGLDLFGGNALPVQERRKEKSA